MANNYSQQIGYHISEAAVAVQIVATKFRRAPKFIYTFENFFHPFVGELIAKLNKESLSGVLDAKWQDSLKQDFFKTLYNPTENDFIQVNYFPKEIDVSALPRRNAGFTISSTRLRTTIPLTSLSGSGVFSLSASWTVR